MHTSFRREYLNSTKNAATFTSIKQRMLGGYRGSIWGKPITTFKTIEGLPYFFNFHNKNDIGHTIIVGDRANKPELLRHFLIFESFKLDLTLANFDHDGSDDEIMTICGAKVLFDGDAVFSVDILSAINNSSEKLCKILSNLLFKSSDFSDEVQKEVGRVMQVLVELIASSKNYTTDLSSIHQKVSDLINSRENTLSSDIKHDLSEFFSLNCFFKFFYLDSALDEKIISISLGNSFDDTKLPRETKEKMKSLMAFTYLAQLNDKFDYTSTGHKLISVESGVLTLGKIFHDEILELFTDLAKKNVVVLINCHNRKDLYNSKEIANIIKNVVPTRFFLSDKFVDSEFKDIFDLSHSDLNKIKMYAPTEYMFLLKQDDLTISASFRILNNFKLTN